MYLLVAATALEMEPLRSRLGEAEDVDFLITGPGPVETTFSLTRYLQAPRKAVEAVLDFGVAGAYPDTGVALLDLCLAEKEVFGDSGICAADTIRDF